MLGSLAMTGDNFRFRVLWHDTVHSACCTPRELTSCHRRWSARHLQSITAPSCDMQNTYMCEQCFKITDQRKICTGCRITWYCSEACQRQAWPSHRARCKAFASLGRENQSTMHDVMAEHGFNTPDMNSPAFRVAELETYIQLTMRV